MLLYLCHSEKRSDEESECIAQLFSSRCIQILHVAQDDNKNKNHGSPNASTIKRTGAGVKLRDVSEKPA